ncbi:MAG TPA: gliding motility-associated C-terminal domain-containing protein [Chitinophagales bacterium]|nr:gliding motility-associated C-terminal domain-containing protein [Chitinophagales bacterium]
MAAIVAGLLPVNAQLFYNNGAQVTVAGGGVLFIDGATENAAGVFSNAGQTTIVGYFRNGSTASGGGAQGIYNVYGDWENNHVFTADQSNVKLVGNAQQITGTSVTTFYDLTLLTQGTVKTQTIDANVTDILSLNDCELATSDYNMHVYNTATGAIARNNGFVSSTGPGRLIRDANSTGTYLFPTGWNDNGSVLYRPIELTPSVINAQSFAVRMGYGDASLEGYDVNTRAGNVTAVNTKFFHLIKQSGSSAAAALSIYYDQNADGTWGSIGRWQTVPQWEDLMQTTFTAGSPLSHRTKAVWTDNGNEPHVLINAKDIQSLFDFPNVFAPGTTDADNNTFHVINQFDLVTVQEIKVFDRWGELVYDANRDGTTCTAPTAGSAPTYCWDGKYRGKLQPMGNYVYQASVKINSTGEVKDVSGNISLLW